MRHRVRALLVPVVWLALDADPAAAQPADLPVVRSTAGVISIRDGDQLHANSWTLAPDARPDVYEAPLAAGRPQRVTFITDVDSIGFLVQEGKAYDFVVLRDGVRHWTRIVGTRVVPAAVFDAAYRRANEGATHVEVPEAYELVNVAIALTPTAMANQWLVYRDTPYYAELRAWFDPHAGHPLIAMLDSALRVSPAAYFTLKMNGRAFEFDERGRLVRSRVYDRTGFRGERRNALEPFAAQLQSFASAARFREFYARHRSFYDAQVAYFRDSADVGAMKRWLERNFPGRRPYQAYRIVFSPLVYANQSVTWFESNGFTELQPHVNFPYPAVFARAGLATLSDSSRALFRGNILFTEINHGYINPEAEQYAERIRRAVARRERWIDAKQPAGYYPGIATFNEYMNWALIDLYLADNAPAAELAPMMESVDRTMVGRGFTQFPAFSKFLVPLYTGRKPGTTLADLYPDIIAWFERNG